MRSKHPLENSRLQNGFLIIYGLIYVILYIYLRSKNLDFIIIGLISAIIGLIGFINRRDTLKPFRAALMLFYFVSFILMVLPVMSMYGLAGSIASPLFIAIALFALMLSFLSLLSR